MPNINAVINEQIRRLARREIRANTKTIKNATGHYRRDIAALKRQMVHVLKQLAILRKQTPQEAITASPEAIQNARLRIDGLKGHRARVGLSAKDYGKLISVSGLTIYNWESGKSKPRRSQLPRIVSVRGIGKREAMQRLGMGGQPELAAVEAKTAASKRGMRGTVKPIAEEFIRSLLKGRKSLTSAQINAAWKKSGGQIMRTTY